MIKTLIKAAIKILAKDSAPDLPQPQPWSGKVWKMCRTKVFSKGVPEPKPSVGDWFGTGWYFVQDWRDLRFWHYVRTRNFKYSAFIKLNKALVIGSQETWRAYSRFVHDPDFGGGKSRADEKLKPLGYDGVVVTNFKSWGNYNPAIMSNQIVVWDSKSISEVKLENDLVKEH
jgi:hypothetical protein